MTAPVTLPAPMSLWLPIEHAWPLPRTPVQGRIVRLLSRAGVMCLGDLTALRTGGLLRLGFGEKSLAEAQRVLGEHGLTLPGETDAPELLPWAKAAKATAAGYKCPSCGGGIQVGLTIGPAHKPHCAVADHIARLRAGRAAS